MYIKYWKSMEFLNGQKIISIWEECYRRQSSSLFMQCYVMCKLSFMIEFRKMKRNNGIELLKFSIQKVMKNYGNWCLKCVGTLFTTTHPETISRNETTQLYIRIPCLLNPCKQVIFCCRGKYFWVLCAIPIRDPLIVCSVAFTATVTYLLSIFPSNILILTVCRYMLFVTIVLCFL